MEVLWTGQSYCFHHEPVFISHRSNLSKTNERISTNFREQAALFSTFASYFERSWIKKGSFLLIFSLSNTKVWHVCWVPSVEVFEEVFVR